MKSSRIVRAMFALVVFGGVETASADPIYSFTTINVHGGIFGHATGINNRGQIVGSFGLDTGAALLRSTSLGLMGLLPGGSITAARSWGGLPKVADYMAAWIHVAASPPSMSLGLFTLKPTGSTTAARSWEVSTTGPRFSAVSRRRRRYMALWIRVAASPHLMSPNGTGGTFAYGINDGGQVVGDFDRGAFLATPVATPEPASLITLATCLFALSGIAYRRKRAGAANRPTT